MQGQVFSGSNKDKLVYVKRKQNDLGAILHIVTVIDV